MKLYYSPGACSLAPHIVLCEAGVDHDMVKVDLGQHRTEDGTDYRTINPKGSVPLLEIEAGQYLSEGPVICQYIADRAERRDLLPAPGTLPRYRVMEWQNFISSELHKSFSPFFNPAIDDKAREIFRGALRSRYAWIGEQLKGKDYLTGSDFTVADAYLFTISRWSGHVGLDLSALQSYMDRVAARPGVKQALAMEEGGG